MDLAIQVRRHQFGELTVLDGIELRVSSGEIVCIIGPSGCGKSTLLGIVGGLIKPTDGEIRMGGAAPAGCLNELTYIFQDFALLPWRTAADNVALVLEHHGLAKAEVQQRTRDALARTSMAEFGDYFPKQLSGGMRQRVGIARALAVRPAVLLMDEPFSALDAQTRELILDDFLDLWSRERLTAVYVTHSLDEAVKVADRIVVLSRRPGRIKEVVQVNIAQEDRHNPDNKAWLAQLTERIWTLIRDEAVIANQEVIDA